MTHLFTVLILYGQLLIGQPGSGAVAVLWTDEEVAQGFAWDPQIVGFGIPDHDGLFEVTVETEREAPFAVADDALWAVSVPFEAGTEVEVGTLLDDPHRFPIRPGAYQLIFQARPGSSGHAYRLDVIFVRGGPPGYAVLKQGELGSGTVLRTRARRV